MANAFYRILDVQLTLEASLELIDTFDLFYRRFRDPCTCERCRTCEFLHVQVQVSKASDSTFHVTGIWGEADIAEGHVMAYLFYLMQNHIIKSVRSFATIHGAVLDIDGMGCVLAAPTSTGKTTLAMELVRRGAGFLSDEIAALALDEPVLHGYHRNLGVREGGVGADGLSMLSTAPNVLIGGETKRVVDPESVRKGTLCVSVRPSVIVFLVPPRDEAGMDSQNEHLELYFATGVERFIDTMRREPGIQSLITLHGRPHPGVRIAYIRAQKIVPDIDRLAAASGAVISSHFRGASLPMDYSKDPSWSELEAGDGIMHLLPAVLNASSLTQRESVASVVFHLSRLLADVKFIELIPGLLHETAATIESICHDYRRSFLAGPRSMPQRSAHT